LRKKEDPRVIAGITITLKYNPEGGDMEAQLNPLLGIIRGQGG
jgi:hypothetical protein